MVGPGVVSTGMVGAGAVGAGAVGACTVCTCTVCTCMHGVYHARCVHARWVHARCVHAWVRAQSLFDPAAARSDRTDHGPWGAYSGWPAITSSALAALGHQRAGLGVLRRAAALTQRGPWGQAHALHRDGGGKGGKGGKGGAAYKPFEFTLYNEAVGAAFVDATLHVVFGLRAAAAPLMDALPWPPLAPDARTPLGAGGVAAELHLLRWQGALFNATAAADGGVTWRAS